MRVAAIAASVVAMACSPQPPSPPLPPAQQAAADARQRESSLPQDVADRSFAWPLSVSDAEQILLDTDIFDIADPAFSPGRRVQAFNVLVDQKDARERFRRLDSNGRAPGRLYALCGLLLVAPPEGVRLAHSLSLKTGNVAVREGDFIFDTPIARAIVLVFADELPERLRKRRHEAYEFFRRPR